MAGDTDEGSRARSAHLVVERLSRHFAVRGGVVRALDEVSLAVPRAGSLGLVGESGCGKTTLARTLLRLLPPTGGRVFLGGVDVTALSAAALRRFRARAQPVFQDSHGALDPRYRAIEAVAEPLRLHQVVPPAAVRDEAMRLLELLGLDGALAASLPHQLSGGQRQRVAIARALASRPELLVADEPLSALDASLRALVLRQLAEERRERGLTLLLIAHDLGAVRLACEQTAVMYLGRLVEQADTRRLFAAPRHPYTRSLLSAEPTGQRRTGAATVSGSTPSAEAMLLGEPPWQGRPPPGCPLHPRCPRYRQLDQPAACRQRSPDLGPGGLDGHDVACHFPL